MSSPKPQPVSKPFTSPVAQPPAAKPAKPAQTRPTPVTLQAASTGDPGTAVLLIALGVGVGYITLRGLWPKVLLALLYPERLTFGTAAVMPGAAAAATPPASAPAAAPRAVTPSGGKFPAVRP